MYGMNGFPGYYGYGKFYGNRGPFYGRYWKREAEAEPTAITAPEADAEAQRFFGYGNYPSPAYGMGYAYGMGLAYPRSNYGRFMKRDAEAEAAAEAYFQYFANPYTYTTYGMNSMGYSNAGPQYGYMQNNFFPYFSNYYNRYF